MANLQRSDWYAVRTNPRSEMRATLSIKEVGFEVYMPEMRKHIVHHRTRVLMPKVYPLLVGYVLTRLPTVAHASHLRGCDGVKGVLGVGGTPIPLPGPEVREIQAAEKQMNDLFERRQRELEKKEHGFRAGDRVCFRRGAYTGFQATVVDGRSKKAIRVMMNVFNTMIEVETPVDFVAMAA